jgi:hypothetical protein
MVAEVIGRIGGKVGATQRAAITEAVNAACDAIEEGDEATGLKAVDGA